MTSRDEMRTRATENLRDLKPDDSYLADEVLTLSRWLLDALGSLERSEAILGRLAELLDGRQHYRPTGEVPALLAPYRRPRIT